MKRINEITAMLLKLDKTISAGQVARVINGKPIHVDLRG